MKWDISTDDTEGCLMQVGLYFESDSELADFVARMGLVAAGNAEVQRLLEAAQEFPELGVPDDEIFEEFYADLCECVEATLEAR